MYAVISNVGDWDTDSLGLIDVVKSKDEFLLKYGNIDDKYPEFITKENVFDVYKIMEENEMSCYSNGSYELTACYYDDGYTPDIYIMVKF